MASSSCRILRGYWSDPVFVRDDWTYLYSRPDSFTKLTEPAPDAGQSSPDCFEIAQLLCHWLESIVFEVLEVERFLGATDQVVFFDKAGKTSVKDVESINGRICLDVPLKRPTVRHEEPCSLLVILPFRDKITDALIDYLVFRDDLEL